jgi:hypothetical protein
MTLIDLKVNWAKISFPDQNDGASEEENDDGGIVLQRVKERNHRQQ